MFIIVDARMPKQVLKGLEPYGQLLLLQPQGGLYGAISGHPDIFFSQTPTGMVISPNAPEEVTAPVIRAGIRTLKGNTPAGNAYPESAAYNAFVNDTYLIHNLKITDKSILERCSMLRALHVNQGYSRCNLIEAAGLYITSDQGIRKVLQTEGKDVLYVDPRAIMLPGHTHGFFGGCAGIWQDHLFLAGSCSHFAEGKALKADLRKRGITIVELYDGKLFDGGGMLFIS